MKRSVTPIDLTSGPILWAILIFSIPLFVGNIFQQLYNVVDSVVVGNFVGNAALAAVGVCSPVIFISISLFMGIGIGTSVVISRYCGAKEPAKVAQAIYTAYVIVFIGCIPLSIAGIFFAEAMLIMTDVPREILPDASQYLRIYFAASCAHLGFGVNDGILRGLGDSKSSLRFLAVACVANIVLDLLFVVIFQWGVAGVAVATVMAQAISWGLSMHHIQKHYLNGTFSILKLTANKQIFQSICKIGIPTGVQYMLFSGGTIVMQAIVNRCGSEFIAGFHAASKIDMFAFMPIQSFSMAATAFVGQNVGAKKYDRIHTGIIIILKMSLVVDIFIVGTVLLFGPQLLGLFNSDLSVIHAGMSYLYRILPFYLIFTVTSMMHSMFRGIGAIMVPTIIMVIALWLARVPSAYFLAEYFGAENMFYCYGIGWIVEIILLGLYYCTGQWRRNLTNK